MFWAFLLITSLFWVGESCTPTTSTNNETTSQNSQQGVTPSYEVLGSIAGPANDAGIKRVIFTVKADSLYCNDLEALAQQLENGKKANEFQMYYVFQNEVPALNEIDFKDVIDVQRFCTNKGAIAEILISKDGVADIIKIRNGEHVFE